MNNPLHYFLYQVATLGPIGKSLPAPGTAGSLVAIILGYYLLQIGWLPFLTLTVLVTFIGVFAAYSKICMYTPSGTLDLIYSILYSIIIQSLLLYSSIFII